MQVLTEESIAKGEIKVKILKATSDMLTVEKRDGDRTSNDKSTNRHE
jgi:hypothetical protein